MKNLIRLNLALTCLLFVSMISAQERVGINTDVPDLTHKLTITSADSNVLRLIGPGTQGETFYGQNARITFGDLGPIGRVFIEEDSDDKLNIFGLSRTSIMGGNVGIGTKNPFQKLHVRGNTMIRQPFGDTKLIIEADSSNTNEFDNPMIEFLQDGGTTKSMIGFAEDSLGANNFGIGVDLKGGVMRISRTGRFGFNTGPSSNETYSLRALPGDIRVLKVEDKAGADIFSVDEGGTVGVNQVYNDFTLNVRGKAEDGTILNVETESSEDKFRVYRSGNVIVRNQLGVGTFSPGQLLTLSKPFEPVVIRMERTDPDRWDYEIVNDGGNLIIRGGSDGIGAALPERIKIFSSGNIGIGTTDDPNSNIASGYKLSVNGKIAATEVRVQPTAQWPDYVFAPGYDLMSLSELEKSIQQNNHLPGIPSAKEIKNDGLELGEMQRKMMEKIEELTLYILNLNQEVESLKKENAQQAAQIKALKSE